jgi:hypothetical protein
VLESTVYRRLTQAEVDAKNAENTKKGIASETLKADVWQRADRGLAVERTDVKTLTPQSKVEIRAVERQQAYVDGKPVGEVFAK